MPYIKTHWESGDTITATGLNNMEEGVEDAVDTAEASLSRIENISFAINDNMELVVTV